MNYAQLIFFVIISVGAGIMIAELSGVMNVVKGFTRHFWFKRAPNGNKWPRRIKPFDCHLCLSFWICLCLCCNTKQLPFEICFGVACVAAVVSTGVMKAIR